MKPPSYIKKAPGWVTEMNMARDWGMPPYKIVGGSKLLWYVRWSVLNEIQMKYRR